MRALPHGLLNFKKGGQWDHLASLRTNLQLADIFGMAAIIRVCLNTHAVSAAKGIEVVDVKRTKIDLQSFENIRDGHAQLACLHAVNVSEKLRNVDLIARVQPRQFRCLIRLGKKCLGCIVKRAEA